MLGVVRRIFSALEHMRYMLLPIHLSITQMYRSKMVEFKIMQLSPHPIPLVFVA